MRPRRRAPRQERKPPACRRGFECCVDDISKVASRGPLFIAERASVPISKFASFRGILSSELRNQRNTSNNVSSAALDLKLLQEPRRTDRTFKSAATGRIHRAERAAEVRNRNR